MPGLEPLELIKGVGEGKHPLGANTPCSQSYHIRVSRPVMEKDEREARNYSVGK